MRDGPIIAAVAFDAVQETVKTSALALAKTLGREVELVHAVEPLDLESPPYDRLAMPDHAFVAWRIRTVTEVAQRSLDAVVADWSGHGVRVSGTLVAGDPRDVVVSEAISRHASLI